jgi:hypothetical protein
VCILSLRETFFPVFRDMKTDAIFCTRVFMFTNTQETEDRKYFLLSRPFHAEATQRAFTYRSLQYLPPVSLIGQSIHRPRTPSNTSHLRSL